MKTADPDEHFPAKSIKEIPKWTRRYARNRTLPFLLSLVLFLVWAFLARTGAKLAIESFRAGNIVEFYFAMAVVAVLVSFLIWFIVPGWGGRWFQKLTKRIYNDHGNVLLSVRAERGNPNWSRYLLPGVFLLGVPTSVVLTRFGFFPYDYLQPVSALYVVPALIFTYASERSTLSPFFLLWPILYSIHAILVVAGAPIQFAGRWSFLNILAPTIGYGVLTGAVGYLVGQYSLKRLRDLASGGGSKP